MTPIILVLVLTLASLLSVTPAAHAASSDLHLTQQVEVLQSGAPVLRESRDLYIQGTAMLMKNSSRSLLIRPDLGKAYLLDPTRALLGEIPMTQLTPEMTGGAPGSTPGGPMPPIRATGEKRTIQGLHCDVHRSTIQAISAEVCITRELAVLERLQGKLGVTADVPGIPVEYLIQVETPDKSGTLTIRQRLTKVERTPQDPALFTVPGVPGQARKP
jgi:hypothetical protein